MKTTTVAIFSFCSFVAATAAAGELGGVSMPETITVEGKKLVLNGLGIREATIFNVDVYVAGLYMETKTKSGKTAIDSKQVKKVMQKFVRDVERDDVAGAWSDGFKANAGDGLAALQDRLTKLTGWMDDVAEGDTMSYTYVPDKGVTVELKGKVKGTIPGEDFARVMWSVWFGPEPPNKGLKRGMLGLD